MIKKFQDSKRIIDKFTVLFPKVVFKEKITMWMDSSQKEENYKINIDKEALILTSKSEAGLLYALIDFHQINKIAQVKTHSHERGLNVDCGRKYYSKDWFLKMIRRMARLKMNTLQIHFSENEGFRLKLNKFQECLSKEFLTKKELKEILDYAEYFYIEVQPSFDSPGHMQKILEYYPEHRLENSKTGLDITNKASRDFVKEIYDEVLDVFKGAQTIHMGGDEFIPFDEYHKYPSLKKYAIEKWGPEAEGFDTYIDYINDISTYLLNKGLKVKVWNDGLYRINQKQLFELNPDLIITYWTSWNKNMAPLQTFIDKGHPVVNFMDQFLYFVLGENAGYTYPTKEKIDHKFKVNQFPLRNESLIVSRDQSIALGSQQYKGAFYSIWSDKPEALSEEAVYAQTKDSMAAFANKFWQDL